MICLGVLGIMEYLQSLSNVIDKNIETLSLLSKCILNSLE